MIRITTFGLLAAVGVDVPNQVIDVQPRRLALLAVIAASGERGIGRDRLLGLFWPESEDAKARNALNQALFSLRKTFGTDSLLVGSTEVRLNPGVISADCVEFDAALARGGYEHAVSLYAGPFLDNAYVRDSAEFEAWVDEQRRRYEDKYRKALERLACEAEAHGQHQQAVKWRKLLARTDPYDARYACAVMRALAAAGEREGALRHARVYEQLLRDELNADPDPAVLELAAQLGEAAQLLPRESTMTSEVPDLPASVVAEPVIRDRKLWRPLLAGAGGVLTVLAIVLSWTAARGSGHRIDRNRVAVEVFQNLTGDTTFNRVGVIAADWLSQGLARTGLVQSVPIGPDAYANDGARARGLAPANVKPGYVVSGVMSRNDSTLHLQATINDWRGRSVGVLEEVTTPISDPLKGIEQLRQQVMAALASHLDENLRAWASATRQPTNFGAYQAFAAGMDAYVRRDMMSAQQQFMTAASLDTAYVLPRLWAVLALDNVGLAARADSVRATLAGKRYEMTPFEAALATYELAPASDFPTRYQATTRLINIAPESEWLYLHAYAAAHVNRPYEAIRTLWRANPNAGWLRGRFGTEYWVLLHQQLHIVGMYDVERRVIREAIRRYPLLPGLQAEEGIPLAAQGRFAEIEKLPRTEWFDALLSRAAFEALRHGYPQAARQLAREALQHYDPSKVANEPFLRLGAAVNYVLLDEPDSLVAVMKAIVRKFPNDVSWHEERGVAAALIGDTAEAGRQLAWLQAQPESQYNQSYGEVTNRFHSQFEILTALNRREEAVTLLHDAVRGGLAFADPVELHREPWLRSLWNYPPFLELIKPQDGPEQLAGIDLARLPGSTTNAP